MKRLPPLNALRAFATAAQTGSFTKAGELLHVTQGAISRQVKMLEQHLDTRLFERAHQSVSLTPAGQALSDALLNAFGHMEEAVEKVRQTPARQMLNINAPPTFATRWLAPRLSDFRSQYPFIDLSITTDRIQTLKSARQHDCLVFFDQAPWPDLACQLLMQEHHIMACSPSLWHGNQPPKLVKATLLHILDGDKRLPVWEQWDLHFGLSGVDTQGGLHFSTLDQAINASIAGAGILVVDQTMIIQELQSGLLKRFDDRELMGPQAYWFAEITQNSQQKELVTTFRTWLMKQLSLSDTRAIELDELSLSPD